MIPILDLVAQYRSLKAEIGAAIDSVLESGVFIMGPNVEAFEKEIAGYLGVRHAISLNSGTDALHLALRALDIGPGDEVITTPFAFAATTEAIGMVGATPVFVDIDRETLNIDPSLVAQAITPRTKALLPVHLYGAPAAMDDIMSLASRSRLFVIEDCAQAIGAAINGVNVGTIGDIGCFSFFPTKNLGAYGDGGLAATSDDRIAARLKSLRLHGAPRKYDHEELGVNSRLDELQAAILRVKLRRLEAWITSRRAIARRYESELSSVPSLALPVEKPGFRHVYHQYTVRLDRRDRVADRLRAAGIQTMVYYPIPLHLQKVNARFGYAAGDFPESEAATRTVLSLPMYPELSEPDQHKVIRSLSACIEDCLAV